MADLMDIETNELVEFLIHERMQHHYFEFRNSGKARKIDEKFKDLERAYQEAVERLPPETAQVIRSYQENIFDSTAAEEELFYRLGLKDGICLRKYVRKVLKSLQ